MFIEVVQVFVKFALETGFGCGQPTFWVWLSAGQPVVNPLFRTLSTMFEIKAAGGQGIICLPPMGG